MSKETPPAGDTWKGRFIPGGTRIGWSGWAMCRREDIWGTDSHEFRPERWLTEGQGGTTPAENVRKMEATIDMIFGHGRYQCLGRPVAFIELNKVFFEASFFQTPSTFLSCKPRGRFELKITTRPLLLTQIHVAASTVRPGHLRSDEALEDLQLQHPYAVRLLDQGSSTGIGGPV